MGTIEIRDLEIHASVGVSEQERAAPQKLMVTLRLDVDWSAAVEGDDLTRTADYDAIARRVARFAREGSWKLIERMASELARLILQEFPAEAVSVEIKKFVLPAARYVAVRCCCRRGEEGLGPVREP